MDHVLSSATTSMFWAVIFTGYYCMKWELYSTDNYNDFEQVKP